MRYILPQDTCWLPGQRVKVVAGKSNVNWEGVVSRNKKGKVTTDQKVYVRWTDGREGPKMVDRWRVERFKISEVRVPREELLTSPRNPKSIE